MSEPDTKWTRDVRVTLDWSQPLDALREQYDRAAEVAVARKPAVLVRGGVAMKDPFASEGAP